MLTKINNRFSQNLLLATNSSRKGNMLIDEKDFYSFLSIKRGLSAGSLRTCMSRIGIINSWFSDKELSKQNVEKFFMELKIKGLKNNTLNTYYFTFQKLYEYCKDRGLPYHFFEGFKSFKKNKPEMIILTLKEIEKILNTKLTYGKFRGMDCSILDFKFRTMTMFLAYTGCRYSEAAELRIKYLDLSAGKATFVNTKTNVNRTTYFEEPLKSNLSELIKDRKSEEKVFRNVMENKYK